MSLPEDLIADARTYADTTLREATTELHDAMQTLQGLGRTIGGMAPPAININPPTPEDPGDPPQYTGLHFLPPPDPAAAGELLSVPSPDVGDAPGEPPEIAEFDPQDKPQGPAGDPNLLSDVPEVDPADFEIEAAPDLLAEIRGITKPELTTITVPIAPSYVEPGFNGVRPSDPGSAPTGLDATMRSQFESGSAIMRSVVNQELDSFLDREFPDFRTGLATLEDRLQTYLDGGSALSATIETAIYNRTLDKQNADATRAMKKAYGTAARAGMTLHTVALASQQKDLDQARRDNNARAAIDIAVKQAELEQNNLQFAVTQSANLRQTAISAALSYYNGLVSLNGQALDYARATVDAIVKAYDLATKYSEVQARVYEAEARVYEARLKGAVARIDAYSAQVRGLEAQSNVNLAKVQAYKAEIEAVTAEATVYRAQVEAVTARASVSRMLVDVYQAKVQAYAAQINARTAEWQGYEAATKGEQAKVAASAEQVRGYIAEVEAYRARVQAKGQEIDAVLKTNEGTTRVYAAGVEAYSALVRGKSTAVAAEVASYDTTIKAFQARASAISDHARAQIAQYDSALRAIIATAQIYMEQLRETHAIDVVRAKGLAEISTTAGEIYGRQAQAALSGMNSLAVATIETTA